MVCALPAAQLPKLRNQQHMNSFDTIFRRGTVVNHHGIHETDLGVANGRITASRNLSRPPQTAGIAVKGLHILPCVVATRADSREPRGARKPIPGPD